MMKGMRRSARRGARPPDTKNVTGMSSGSVRCRKRRTAGPVDLGGLVVLGGMVSSPARNTTMK